MTPHSPRSIATILLPSLSAAALLSAALASVAVAHAPFESTSPEAGANLDEPPTEVVMVFGGELDPEESGFIVTDAEGSTVGTGRVDLDVPERNELRGEVEISEPGVYTVNWTSVGADGHEEEGTFAFGFNATSEQLDAAAAGDQATDAAGDQAADAAAAGDQPNTAVPSSAGAPTTVVAGAALLLLAVGLGGRSLVRRNADN